MTDHNALVERLSEDIIADAFESKAIMIGRLAERLIRERKDAADAIQSLQEQLSTAQGERDRFRETIRRILLETRPESECMLSCVPSEDEAVQNILGLQGEVERLKAEREPRSMDSAPGPGIPFLAKLSTGKYAILSEPYNAPNYAWYIGGEPLVIPVERTHPPESLADCTLAVGWWPLPQPQEGRQDGPDG